MLNPLSKGAGAHRAQIGFNQSPNNIKINESVEDELTKNFDEILLRLSERAAFLQEVDKIFFHSLYIVHYLFQNIIIRNMKD